MKKKKPTKNTSSKMITTEEFDRRFDNGESVMEFLDMDSAVFRVNIDFPAWVVTELDKEATRLGISRQALVKVWTAEQLDRIRAAKKAGT